MPAAMFDGIEIVDGGEALRWPDGSYLLAEGLRARLLHPPRRDPPMSAAVMARWADDGGDVRWELADGTPVPRPIGSVGHAVAVTEVSCHLAAHCHGRGAGRMLMHSWVGRRRGSRDLRIADIIVMPLRRFGRGPAWVDDAICLIEISETATAWSDGERLAAFRCLPTVQEIATLDGAFQWARVERRTDAGWRVEEVEADGMLRLAAIGWGMPLPELARSAVDAKGLRALGPG
ncbi:MAG TPA: Uma2 family endonuclease [Azospirillum sp.]|nr:Uma2 family endonuclease [Azospirillum sp.]